MVANDIWTLQKQHNKNFSFKTLLWAVSIKLLCVESAFKKRKEFAHIFKDGFWATLIPESPEKNCHSWCVVCNWDPVSDASFEFYITLLFMGHFKVPQRFPEKGSAMCIILLLHRQTVLLFAFHPILSRFLTGCNCK